jgi:CDGSH-type Zn-finger protein
VTCPPTSGDATIEVTKNGPYRLRGAIRLCDSNGEDIAARGTLVLCRCGNSSKKPFCDGTHRKTGFDGARLTVGPADGTQQYRGKRITIHDNRAICSHAGVCTDNLPGVFRLGQEPWIAADGEEAAAIVKLVARCPSGALSCTVDDMDAPDESQECTVTVSQNGPYFVRGSLPLKADGAQPFRPGRYALCRCGASKNKPFCDGTHWAMGFDDKRGLQAGVWVPPLGIRRFSLVFGGLLLAVTAAAVIGIEAAGKLPLRELTRSGALIPELNLALEILLVAGLTFGSRLAKRGNIAAHRYNQTVWVLLNALLVALIMAGGMQNAVVESAAELVLIGNWMPWLHAVIGTATVICGLWLVLQMNGLLPQRLHVRGWKKLMQLTLAGYWAVALSGIALYYVWFLR